MPCTLYVSLTNSQRCQNAHLFTSNGELTYQSGQTWSGHIYLGAFGVNAGLSLNMSYDPPRLSMSGCSSPSEISFASVKTCGPVHLEFEFTADDCCANNGKGVLLLEITE